MLTDDNLSIVRKLYDEVWSGGDLGVIDELVDNNFIGHATPNEMTIRGIDQFRQRVALYRDIFPEMAFSIEDQFGCEDRVVTRWKVQLEQSEEAIKRDTNSGEPITFVGISIHRFSEGKIVEEWDTWDTMAVVESAAIPDVIRSLTLSF